MTEPKRTLLDRLLAAYPLVLAYFVLLTLYAWQTTRIPSPWIFTDELQWSLLSRAIAHTGRPELREQSASAASLYSYFLAPAWWAGTTSAGYAAAKYLNAIVMAASIFPAYALARFFVPRPAAMLAAIATAAIPSLALTGVLMPETLAYFWSTLALWLTARALLRPTRWTIALAAAAVIVGPLIRGQLEVLMLAALLAGALVAATSARGRAIVGGWTRGELIGAVVLAAGFVIAVDVFLAHHSYEWYIGTHFWHRALTYGVWAFGALTIGVGVLPVLLALAWTLGAPIETREDRALLGLVVGATIGFGVYTAVKASYISTNFSIRVEERNLIYLSPIVFIAATRWLVARRVRVVPLVVATAAVAYLLWSTPYHATEHLYSDAFGLSILQWLNQTWYWTTSDLEWLLFGILAAGAVLALASARATPRVFKVAVVVLALATIGWNLAGELSAASQAVAPAKSELSRIPTPPDWIDAQTGKARTLFISYALQNSDAFWTLEFWNQSIQDVWSVDASAPPPGPQRTPNFLGTDGAVDPQLPFDWAVAPPAIVMHGTVVEKAGGLVLYRVPHPVRIQSFVSGLTADGWMELQTAYVRFAPHRVPGTLTISVSRSAACGGTIRPSRFTFRVAHLGVTPEPDAQPVSRAPQAMRSVVVPQCGSRILHIHATAPLRVVGTATHPFDSGDGRKLSAFVDYSFTPDRAGN